MHRPTFVPTFERWGGRRDSNPRRPESQSGALPAELRPPSSNIRLEMARPAGIEPATAGLEGRCSIRLSYGRFTNQQVTAPIVFFSGRRSGPKQTESEVRADYIAVCRYLKRRMAVRLFLAGAGCIAGRLLLDGELEFCERMVP